MRQTGLLIVPSRSETFSAVAAEALASGTPVVATRCGGPEDFVTPDVGRLVPIENPAALAQGIDEMLDIRHTFDPMKLHEYAVARFGRRATAARFGALYGRLVGTSRARRGRAE